MSQWQPCKRRLFIKRLRKLGFDGPCAGSRHQFMVYENHRLSVPSNSDYSIPQLKMMISEVEIIMDRRLSIEEWNAS